MPYSAPTPKAYDGLMPTENSFSFYTGLKMSKVLVCDGEIVFSEQTDVTIITYIVTAHSSSNPRKPLFHVSSDNTEHIARDRS